MGWLDSAERMAGNAFGAVEGAVSGAATSVGHAVAEGAEAVDGATVDAGHWMWDHHGELGEAALTAAGFVPGVNIVTEGLQAGWYGGKAAVEGAEALMGNEKAKEEWAGDAGKFALHTGAAALNLFSGEGGELLSGGEKLAEHGAEALAEHGTEAAVEHGGEALAEHGAEAGAERAAEAGGDGLLHQGETLGKWDLAHGDEWAQAAKSTEHAAQEGAEHKGGGVLHEAMEKTERWKRTIQQGLGVTENMQISEGSAVVKNAERLEKGIDGYMLHQAHDEDEEEIAKQKGSGAD